MGCGGSKVDEYPLVTLCKERKQFIKAASDHRLALAAAHIAYFHSLKDVGDAIRRFVDEEVLISAAASSPGSPLLTLPSQEGKSKGSSPSTSISHSLDSSGHSHVHVHDHDHDLGHKKKGKKKHAAEEELEDSHLHLSSPSGSDTDSDPHPRHRRFHDNHDKEEHEAGERGRDLPPSTSYNYDGGGDNFPLHQGNWGYNYPGENSYPYSYPFPDPIPNPYPYPYPNPFPNPYSNVYYMKKSTTPAKTVVYEDPSVNGYSSFYGNGGGGYYGYPMMAPPVREPSPEKTPPPPPSPPRASTWDFLNVFDSYDPSGYPSYYPARRYGYGSTTSSPDSKEVREREGIPDLEDETEHEAIKEVHKEKKKMINEEVNGNVSNGKFKFNEEMKRRNDYGEGTSKSVPVRSTSSDSIESIKGKGVKTSSMASPDTYRSPDSIVSKSPDLEDSARKKGVSFEVEEISAVDVESSKRSSLTTLSAHGTRDLQEVVKEIRDEFETATSYGKEVALMLEVGSLPYQRRSTSLKVLLSRILYRTSSHPQIPSAVMRIAKSYSVDPGVDFGMKSRNLSSTLQKLYAWEKKLYKEVKDEERLRSIYEKECRRLKILDERGAETSKIEATQASIRRLLTKINVCIRAVDAISSKIHRVRDEELQPQITELIHGLIRMWNCMLRCHQKQFRALMESKVRSLKGNTGLRGDSGLKATLELEMELISWCTRFNSWIRNQKLYVESLYEWLMRCLDPEPEVTADGIAPFSPGRAGAPPIFVICNDWYQAMVRISEKRVENAMLQFASNLHQLWERQDDEQRQRLRADHLKRDFEKQLRALRMERARIQQEHDAPSDKFISKVHSENGVSALDDLKVDLDSMRKKLEDERARHKEAAKLVHDAASNSIQAGLVPIFEALGNFSLDVLKAHEQVRLDYTGGS